MFRAVAAIARASLVACVVSSQSARGRSQNPCGVEASELARKCFIGNRQRSRELAKCVVKRDQEPEVLGVHASLMLLLKRAERGEGVARGERGKWLVWGKRADKVGIFSKQRIQNYLRRPLRGCAGAVSLKCIEWRSEQKWYKCTCQANRFPTLRKR